MSAFTEKISYIKGLCAGLSVDESTKEGRVLLAIIDALSAAAKELEEINENIEDIDDVLEEIVDDMFDDDDDDDDDDEFIELCCPKCNQSVYIDRTTFDINDNQTCPMCGASMFEDEEDDGETEE